MAGFELDEDDARLVAGICDRLDRLPLGIELAAGRARHLRLPELLDRLGDPSAVLDGVAPTAPANRRGLRAVAEWSYVLLDDTERLVFQGVAVFADGATLDGAASVCAALGVVPGDVELTLGRLVDKSLVHVDREGAATRYRMLQTLCDYSLDRLAESGAEDVVRRGHARWVADLAATVAFGARTTGRTVAAVQDEEVAVRDALTWAQAADPLLALDIVTALAPFWFGSMRVSSGWAPLTTTLDAARGADDARRASAVAWAALFSAMSFDDTMSARLSEEADAIESRVRDPACLGIFALTRALAVGYTAHVDDARADAWFAQARAHFTALDHHIGLGYVSFAEGALQLVAGDQGRAATSLGAAVDTFRAHGDHLGLILAVSRLGELAWRTGDVPLFVDMHAELLELGRAGRSEGVVAGATARLAVGRLEQGGLEDAEALAAAALAVEQCELHAGRQRLRLPVGCARELGTGSPRRSNAAVARRDRCVQPRRRSGRCGPGGAVLDRPEQLVPARRRSRRSAAGGGVRARSGPNDRRPVGRGAGGRAVCSRRRRILSSRGARRDESGDESAAKAAGKHTPGDCGADEIGPPA